MSTGSFGSGYDTSLHARVQAGGNGSGSAQIAADPCGPGPIEHDGVGTAFRDAGDRGQAHHLDVHVYLRLAVGVPELVSSLDKLQHLGAFVALWHEFHLPAAEILAPAFAAAELVGALLLLAGWQTRTVAALFVAELLSEILLTKEPLVNLSGWMLEWQALCVVLILARIGAGPWSLDRLFLYWRSSRAARTRLSGNREHQEALGHDPAG